MSDRTHHRASVASLSRNADNPDLISARRDLKAASLAEHISRTVASAPPLTAEQRDRLALLLRGGDAGGNAA